MKPKMYRIYERAETKEKFSMSAFVMGEINLKDVLEKIYKSNISLESFLRVELFIHI